MPPPSPTSPRHPRSVAAGLVALSHLADGELGLFCHGHRTLAPPRGRLAGWRARPPPVASSAEQGLDSGALTSSRPSHPSSLPRAHDGADSGAGPIGVPSTVWVAPWLVGVASSSSTSIASFRPPDARSLGSTDFISSRSLSLARRSCSSNVKASDKLTAKNVLGSLTLSKRGQHRSKQDGREGRIREHRAISLVELGPERLDHLQPVDVRGQAAPGSAANAVAAV